MLHAIAPFLHGAPGLRAHAAPVAHGMQVPAPLHTWPVPQLAPGVFGVPFEQLTGLQATTPFAH